MLVIAQNSNNITFMYRDILQFKTFSFYSFHVSVVILRQYTQKHISIFH